MRCLGNVDWTYRSYHETVAHYQESLDIAKQLGDDELAAGATAMLGNVATSMGDWARSREYHQEALRIYRSLGADWSVALARGNLADASLRLGDAAAAAALYEQARATFALLGDDLSEVWCLIGWSEALHFVGERDRAWRSYRELLPWVVAIGERRMSAYALSKGGLMALDAGDHHHAELFLATALHTRVAFLGREMAASDLSVLAEIAAASGDPRRAARLLGAASAFMAETGDALETLVRDRFERTAAALRECLGVPEFDASWSVGHSSLDTVISDAAAGHTDDLQTLVDYVEADRHAAAG